MQGRFYDGISAAASDVEVIIAAGQFVISPALAEPIEFDALTLSERLGTIPRAFVYPNGARVEVPQSPELEAWLTAHGASRGVAERLERRTRYVVGALVSIAIIVISFAKWGVPQLSKAIAERLPVDVLDQLGRETLEQLDQHFMSKSELPVARKMEIASLLDSLYGKLDGSARSELMFRKGKSFGANAFALPNGSIVVTDELARLAHSNDELASVLLHERGHVVHRHAARLLLSHAGLAAMSAIVLGDLQSVGTLMVAAPSMLLEASYSRDLEWEADGYALQRLTELGRSPASFADMLERLERCQTALMNDKDKQKKKHSECGATASSDTRDAPNQDNRTTENAASNGDESPNWENYLSSHPANKERIQRFREAAKQAN